MELEEGAESTRRFDLSALVEFEWRHNLRSVWVTTVSGVVLGLFLVAIAVYTGFIRPSGPSMLDYAETGVLIATGLALIGGGWKYYQAMRRKPNLLVVSPQGLAFGQKEELPLRELLWDGPRLKFKLYDRAELSRWLGGRNTYAAYSLVPKGRARIPIPDAAFLAILAEAERHGVTAQKADVPGFGAMPPVTIFSFQRPRVGRRERSKANS